MIRCHVAALALAASAVFSSVVAAQSSPSPNPSYPNKPLRWIVPVPAGGPADTVARLLGPKLADRLGQPVLIENRAGAAMNIGMEAAARAAPDGYTLCFVVPSMVTNPSLYQLNFDPIRDLAPVARVNESHFVLLAHPMLPVRSVADVLSLAKEKPGRLTYGGGGALPQLSMEILKSMAGVDITMVPYKGNAPAMTALVSGEIDLLVDVAYATLGQIRSGKVRALATTAPRSLLDGTLKPPFASLPAVADTIPGYEFVGWQGVVTAAATPREIINQLSQAFAAILQLPEVRQRASDLGLDIAYAPPDAFGAIIRCDYEKYAKAIREAGIKAE